MASKSVELLALNRGVVSPLLFARLDVPRVALSAETMTNWIPRELGAMSMRPGTKYIGATHNNAAAKHIPFVYDATDKAIIELTNLAMRVRISDTILTRPTTSAAVTNGNFDTDLTGWTDADEGATTSAWLTGGYMSLLGDGTNAAKRTQSVSIGAFAGTEHALRVVIARGPVTIRVGSSGGADDYVAERVLRTGHHSLAFTPTGTFHITLQSRTEYPVLVDSCTVEAAGAVVLTSPISAAFLNRVRFAQSADVVFVTCADVRPQRIERSTTRSWAIVDYTSDAGPFRLKNATKTTITASALTGSVTLTASTPTFTSTMVGGLFSVESDGQTVTQAVSSDNTFTNTILVKGAGVARTFGIYATGTWAGTLTLQRSLGDDVSWTDVITYTTNQSTTLDDSLEDQIAYYRIGIKSGGYISGTANLTLVYANGSIAGIARITGFTSTTSVSAVVLKDMGSVTATTKWAEGAWSDYRGFPSALAFRDGRLWLAGLDKVWASVVDDFENHDPTYLGDAGPIARSIGEGAVDTFRWMASADSLLLGGDLQEFRLRADSQEGYMTNLNVTLRPVGTMGSYYLDDIEKLDGSIIMVGRSGAKVYQLTPEGDRYTPVDLAMLSPEILQPYVIDVAVQRHPDTRIHCVRSDGKVAILISSPTEDVRAWCLFETDGVVEEAFTLPGTEEDEVYYVVKRTINAATVRYLERWALESDCVGGLLNEQADAYAIYDGAPTTSITGLGHLEGSNRAVWADGLDVGPLTVASGAVTLTVAASKVVVGLTYTAQFKSTKLATNGVELLTRKRVKSIGVMLANTHAQGLKYGPDFSTLDDLPPVEAGATVTATGIWAAYNYEAFTFNGSYTVDSRLCLQAAAPRPCTVLAAIVNMDQGG